MLGWVQAVAFAAVLITLIVAISDLAAKIHKRRYTLKKKRLEHKQEIDEMLLEDDEK